MLGIVIETIKFNYYKTKCSRAFCTGHEAINTDSFPAVTTESFTKQ